MSATLSLLDLVERPSILDADSGDRDHEGRSVGDPERVERRHERGSITQTEPDERRHERCDHVRVRRPQIGRERSDRGDQTLPAAGGAPTLDDVLTGIWETIMSDEPATCPVCHGVLEPRHSSGAAPVGGRCTTCGTELS